MSDRVTTLRNTDFRGVFSTRKYANGAIIAHLASNALKLMTGNRSRTKEILKRLLKIENNVKVIDFESLRAGSKILIINFKSLI